MDWIVQICPIDGYIYVSGCYDGSPVERKKPSS